MTDTENRTMQHDSPANDFDSDSNTETDADSHDREPIPVEEWLEEVATMTQEIYRPEVVSARSVNSPTKAAPMNPTSAEQESGTRAERREHGTSLEPQHPASGHGGDGQDTEHQGAMTAGSTEILGSFRPIASAGPDGARDLEPGSRDASVVIGIVQTLPNSHYSRPVPVRSAAGPLGAGRLLGLMALVLTLVALGGGAGYGAARFIPERWTAEAEIILDAGLDQPDRFLGTQQVLVQSSTVLDRAVADLPVDREYVEEELKVFPIESGLALGITFVDEEPEVARSVVESVLSSYMDEVKAGETDTTSIVYRQRLEQLTEQRNLVEQRLTALEKANAEAESAELPLPYPGDVRRLATESDQLLAQIVVLEETLLTLEIGAVQREDAVIVTEPRVLAEPTWPKPLALAAIGMLAGAILAVACLFLLSARRDAEVASTVEDTS